MAADTPQCRSKNSSSKNMKQILNAVLQKLSSKVLTNAGTAPALPCFLMHFVPKNF